MIPGVSLVYHFKTEDKEEPAYHSTYPEVETSGYGRGSYMHSITGLGKELS